MPDTQDFYVRFWGVRGSIACPGPNTIRYGGNTSCVELRCGEHLVIFDAGTGLRQLGSSLKGQSDLDLDIMLSHTHLDHIIGLPFFGPLFDSKNHINFWAGHLEGEYSLKQALGAMMSSPLFPIPIEEFDAATSFHDFEVGSELEPKPGLKIKTTSLNHPDKACAYRVDFGGKSICYVTDTEHKTGELDRNILDLIEGTDIFIYDSMYTDEEYPQFKGWGHSTWQEGVRLADAGKVGRLVLFHHDPSHNDSFMDEIASGVDRARPGSLVAQEGMVVKP